MISEIFFILWAFIGIGVGFICWYMVLLPLFYSLPKSLFNIFRGEMKWGVLREFIIPPLIFTPLILILVYFFPSISENVPLYCGSIFGFLVGTRHLWTKNGRGFITSDYESLTLKYRV